MISHRGLTSKCPSMRKRFLNSTRPCTTRVSPMTLSGVCIVMLGGLSGLVRGEACAGPCCKRVSTHTKKSGAEEIIYEINSSFRNNQIVATPPPRSTLKKGNGKLTPRGLRNQIRLWYTLVRQVSFVYYSMRCSHLPPHTEQLFIAARKFKFIPQQAKKQKRGGKCLYSFLTGGEPFESITRFADGGGLPSYVSRSDSLLRKKRYLTWYARTRSYRRAQADMMVRRLRNARRLPHVY